MSLRSERGGLGKITGVPKFNGNTEEFPIFCVKFEGLVYRLGQKCSRALKHTSPYEGFVYGEEYREEQFQLRRTEQNHTGSSSASAQSSSSLPSTSSSSSSSSSSTDSSNARRIPATPRLTRRQSTGSLRASLTSNSQQPIAERTLPYNVFILQC